MCLFVMSIGQVPGIGHLDCYIDQSIPPSSGPLSIRSTIFTKPEEYAPSHLAGTKRLPDMEVQSRSRPRPRPQSQSQSRFVSGTRSDAEEASPLVPTVLAIASDCFPPRKRHHEIMRRTESLLSQDKAWLGFMQPALVVCFRTWVVGGWNRFQSEYFRKSVLLVFGFYTAARGFCISTGRILLWVRWMTGKLGP